MGDMRQVEQLEIAAFRDFGNGSSQRLPSPLPTTAQALKKTRRRLNSGGSNSDRDRSEACVVLASCLADRGGGKDELS